MAGRSKYSEQDIARIYVALSANDGNIQRASKDTGIPESTIRRWRDEFKEKGPPSTDALEAAVGDFVEEAETVRGMALDVIKRKVEWLRKAPEDKIKVAELVTLVGVLDDKITRVKGPVAKSRVDHHHHLPSPDELRAALSTLKQGALEAARVREEEIVDAEFTEQAPRALPAP